MQLEITNLEKNTLGLLIWENTQGDPMAIREFINKYLDNDLFTQIEVLGTIRGEDTDVDIYDMKKASIEIYLKDILMETYQADGQLN